MSNPKLIKSFIVTKKYENLKEGDIITMRRFQAQIPLIQDELYFESGSNSFSFSFLNNNLSQKHVKVHEYFKNMEEKFDHLL
jgi:hypothetical protein